MGIAINWKNFISSAKVFITMLVMLLTLNQSIYGARLACSGMFDNTIKEAYDLITAIQARESYAAEDWLLIITSDHGGMMNGHGTRTTDCRTTFIATNKAITVNG